MPIKQKNTPTLSRVHIKIERAKSRSVKTTFPKDFLVAHNKITEIINAYDFEELVTNTNLINYIPVENYAYNVSVSVCDCALFHGTYNGRKLWKDPLYPDKQILLIREEENILLNLMEL